MPYGETYVSVDASAVSVGISPMTDISGVTPPYDGGVVVTLQVSWTYDPLSGEGGFSGRGWFWNDSNNILNEQIWGAEGDFKNWLREGDKTEELNDIFRRWPADEKATFMTANQSSLGAGDCLVISVPST